MIGKHNVFEHCFVFLDRLEHFADARMHSDLKFGRSCGAKTLKITNSYSFCVVQFSLLLVFLDNHGSTALIYAAMKNNLDMVKELVKIDGIDVNAQSTQIILHMEHFHNKFTRPKIFCCQELIPTVFKSCFLRICNYSQVPAVFVWCNFEVWGLV